MEFYLIGKLIKPFGIKGMVKVDFYIDDFEELNAFSNFYIKDKLSSNGFKILELTEIRQLGERYALGIADCESRDVAETYRDIEVFVDINELPKLDKDEFYIKDLVDMEVFYKEAFFGKVKNIIEVADRFILIIRMENGKEIAVPFSDTYIGDIDITNKRIESKAVDTLL
jgi:16S rRNA processing protein RimM